MTYKLDTVFKFGKHKGKTTKEIIEEDISYIVWCITDVKDFKLSDDAITHFIDNKNNIVVGHSRMNQEPMQELGRLLMENDPNPSKEEFNKLWNKAIGDLLKKNH